MRKRFPHMIAHLQSRCMYNASRLPRQSPANELSLSVYVCLMSHILIGSLVNLAVRWMITMMLVSPAGFRLKCGCPCYLHSVVFFSPWTVFNVNDYLYCYFWAVWSLGSPSEPLVALWGTCWTLAGPCAFSVKSNSLFEPCATDVCLSWQQPVGSVSLFEPCAAGLCLSEQHEHAGEVGGDAATAGRVQKQETGTGKQDQGSHAAG